MLCSPGASPCVTRTPACGRMSGSPSRRRGARDLTLSLCFLQLQDLLQHLVVDVLPENRALRSPFRLAEASKTRLTRTRTRGSDALHGSRSSSLSLAAAPSEPFSSEIADPPPKFAETWAKRLKNGAKSLRPSRVFENFITRVGPRDCFGRPLAEPNRQSPSRCLGAP